jgi:UDP-N-acetylmuramate--alanine ligase
MDLESVRQGLKNFKGAGRRFEKKFEDRSREIEWIDDYGHHPTEVRATLQAAREICGARKLKVVFQPHRFSRTQLCEKDFLTCFDLADEVSILDIYAAGEAPISGIHSKIFTERVQASLSSRGLSTRVTYGGTLDQETEKLKQWFQGQASQTLIISLGAGNITTLADRVRVSLGI